MEQKGNSNNRHRPARQRHQPSAAWDQGTWPQCQARSSNLQDIRMHLQLVRLSGQQTDPVPSKGRLCALLATELSRSSDPSGGLSPRELRSLRDIGRCNDRHGRSLNTPLERDAREAMREIRLLGEEAFGGSDSQPSRPLMAAAASLILNASVISGIRPLMPLTELAWELAMAQELRGWKDFPSPQAITQHLNSAGGELDRSWRLEDEDLGQSASIETWLRHGVPRSQLARRCTEILELQGISWFNRHERALMIIQAFDFEPPTTALKAMERKLGYDLEDWTLKKGHISTLILSPQKARDQANWIASLPHNTPGRFAAELRYRRAQELRFPEGASPAVLEFLWIAISTRLQQVEIEMATRPLHDERAWRWSRRTIEGLLIDKARADIGHLMYAHAIRDQGSQQRWNDAWIELLEQLEQLDPPARATASRVMEQQHMFNNPIDPELEQLPGAAAREKLRKMGC